MGLAMVLLFLLAGDPFAIRKTQLRETITGAEMLLITAIYMLLSLRGRLPVYIAKSACTLVCNKAREKVEEINGPVYLPVPLCRTAALFWLQARTERHFCLLSIELNHVTKDRTAFITADGSGNKQIGCQAATDRH
jgi:hypothetical protein